jgi:hypothetical protein
MLENEFIPTFTHATERDIDVLLVEELIASTDFQQWIAKRAGWSENFGSSRVLHSKRRTRNRREIDIHVELWTANEDKPIVLLVENKLDADEQPDQAESYREELERIAGKCTFAAMLIVCPKSYASAQTVFVSKFDAIIFYEDIIEFMKSRMPLTPAELHRRLQFRTELLEQALHKYRRGYISVPNVTIGSFNQRYVRLLSKLVPSILPGPTMLMDANPDESVSMIFDHAGSLSFLPDQVRPRRFAHEFGKNEGHRANYAAVTFARWGLAFDAVKSRLYSDTEDYGFEFSAKKPTKNRPQPGLIMSLETSPVNNQGVFEDQPPYVEMGIRSALRLQSWLKNKQDKLFEWKRLVDKALG